MLFEVTVALVVGTFVFLYLRWTRKYGTLEKLQIPVKAPFLCFGSGPWDLHNHVLHETYGKFFELDGRSSSKTIGHYDGFQPVILTTDPDVIKEVFVTKFKHFPGRAGFSLDDRYQTLDVLHGDQWACIRKSLSPVFTGGKIQNMIEPIEECTDKMLNYLHNTVGKSSTAGAQIDIKELMNCVTLEVILKVAFGVDGNLVGNEKLNKDSLIYRQIAAIMNGFISTGYISDFLMLIFKLEPSLVKLAFGSAMKFRDYINQLVTKVVMKRDGDGLKDSGDFIDRLRYLLKAVKEAGGRLQGVSPEMVTCQGILFLLAGYDTTASTITNLIHCLSKNQEAQELCYQDVCNNASNSEDINYETISGMKYLEACINETLRLFPALVRNERLCRKSTEVKGIKIEEGVRVDVPIWVLHRDKSLYGEDADVFNPDRFVSGGKSPSDVAFHAFGIGPRQCLGMRFAYVEIKIIIAKLIFSYKILDVPGLEIKHHKGAAIVISMEDSPGQFQKRC